jgi:soluble lytic murein transglycosylase-like protein
MADNKSKPSLNAITQGALSQVPSFLTRGLDSSKLNVVKGDRTQGYHHDAIASVADDKPNTIVIHDEDKFRQPGAATQVITHELTHRLLDSQPPTLQSKLAPVNPQDPYSYDENNLNQPLNKFSQEQLAGMTQTVAAYNADPSISPARKAQVNQQYAPIMRQLAQLPQATINTDQSGQVDSTGKLLGSALTNPDTMNVTPNAPQGQMYANRLVKLKRRSRVHYDDSLIAPTPTINTTPTPPAAFQTDEAGDTVPGLVQTGNIDVNHRPSITNADGSHSSIFSMTIPINKDGSVWKGAYDAAPQYALVPSIANGKFLTPNGKIPAKGDSKALSALEDKATDYYNQTRQHLGIFSSPDAADQYASQTHAYMNDGSARKVYTPSARKESKQMFDAMPDVQPDVTMNAPTTQPSNTQQVSQDNEVSGLPPGMTLTPPSQSTSSDSAAVGLPPGMTLTPPRQSSVMLPKQNPTLPNGLAPGINSLVQDTSAKYGLRPEVIRALIQHESSGDPNAKNPTSTAKGLMQLVDGTARMMGVTDSFNPAQNIEGGTKYLAQLTALHGGDVREGLAAYYGSRDRTANLKYADSILQKAGPEAALPAGMTLTAPMKQAEPSQPSVASQPPQPQPTSTPQQTEQPQFSSNAPKSISEKVAQWSENLQHDLENGTDITGVGSLLKALGAHGVYNGNSKAVGDFMASLPLGLLKVVQGGAEATTAKTPSQVMQAGGHLVGGTAQAATMPSGFVAPDAGEVVDAGLGKLGEGLDSAAGAYKGAITDAGQAVNSKVGQLPITKNGIAARFNSGFGDVVSKVADDAGVKVAPSDTLVEQLTNTAQAIRAKASTITGKASNVLSARAPLTQQADTLDALANKVKSSLDADGNLTINGAKELHRRLTDLDSGIHSDLEKAVGPENVRQLFTHVNDAQNALTWLTRAKYTAGGVVADRIIGHGHSAVLGALESIL